MKKLLVLMFALIMGVSYVPAILAQEAAAPEAAVPEAVAPAAIEEAAPVAIETAATALTVSGKVVSVDAATSTVVVESTDEATQAAQTTTFSVSESTKIAKGEGALTLADVQADAKVTVAYTVVDGTNVASAIEVVE